MSIRTTVTLDEDVYERLKEESRRRGEPFRTTLNEAIRCGISHSSAPQKREFFIQTRAMGSRRGLNYDDVESLIESAEGPGYR